MENLIIIAIILIITGLAFLYIYRLKKKGMKCIGCKGCCCNCSQSCSKK